MGNSQSKADLIVEEGLALYSQGKLEGAIAKWQEALRLNPTHHRAQEYIRYVEDNRMALEVSFGHVATDDFLEGALPSHEDQEWGEPENTLASFNEVTGAGRNPLRPGPEETTGRMSPRALSDRIQESRIERLPSLGNTGDIFSLGTEESLDFALHDKTPSSISFGPPGTSSLSMPGLAIPSSHSAPSATFRSTLLGVDSADKEPQTTDELFSDPEFGFEPLQPSDSLEVDITTEEFSEVVTTHPSKEVPAVKISAQEILSNLKNIPVILIPQHKIVWQRLDHRAGFLLSRIDGELRFEDILDVCSMDNAQARSILIQLINEGVIGIRK